MKRKNKQTVHNQEKCKHCSMANCADMLNTVRYFHITILDYTKTDEEI